jgi:hypothetical protein
MTARPKQYTDKILEKFITDTRLILTAYEDMQKCVDIQAAYLSYLRAGENKYCIVVSRMKLSCELVCPMCVVFGRLCTEQRSYLKMAELSESGTSRAVQERILLDRIKVYKILLSDLEGMRL